MSVSSVSSAPPVAPLAPIETRPPEQKKPDIAEQSSRTAPLPPPAPLPPGQGTRIDQMT